MEENGRGVFTTLFVDALNGAACNLIGDISLGSIYAHIDQSLSAWDQRPVFKTNVKSFISLRNVQPPISLTALQRITKFFPKPRRRVLARSVLRARNKGARRSACRRPT